MRTVGTYRSTSSLAVECSPYLNEKRYTSADPTGWHNAGVTCIEPNDAPRVSSHSCHEVARSCNDNVHNCNEVTYSSVDTAHIAGNDNLIQTNDCVTDNGDVESEASGMYVTDYRRNCASYLSGNGQVVSGRVSEEYETDSNRGVWSHEGIVFILF